MKIHVRFMYNTTTKIGHISRLLNSVVKKTESTALCLYTPCLPLVPKYYYTQFAILQQKAYERYLLNAKINPVYYVSPNGTISFTVKHPTLAIDTTTKNSLTVNNKSDDSTNMVTTHNSNFWKTPSDINLYPTDPGKKLEVFDAIANPDKLFMRIFLAYYHVTIPPIGGLQVSGLIGLSSVLRKSLNNFTGTNEDIEIQKYLVVKTLQVINIFRGNIPDERTFLSKIMQTFGDIQHPMPKQLSQYFGPIALTQHIVNLLTAYKLYDRANLDAIAEGLINNKTLNQYCPVQYVIEQGIYLKVMYSTLKQNSTIKVHAVDPENISLIPEYKQEDAIVACGQPNTDFVGIIPTSLTTDRSISITTINGNGFVIYHDVKAGGNHAFSLGRITITEGMYRWTLQKAYAHMNKYTSSLNKIRGELDLRTKIGQQKHALYSEALIYLRTIAEGLNKNNITTQLSLFNAYLLHMSVQEKYKYLYVSLTADAGIDHEFLLLQPFMTTEINGIEDKVIAYDVFFPRESIPDPIKISREMQKLIKYFPENEQISFWHCEYCTSNYTRMITFFSSFITIKIQPFFFLFFTIVFYLLSITLIKKRIRKDISFDDARKDFLTFQKYLDIYYITNIYYTIFMVILYMCLNFGIFLVFRILLMGYEIYIRTIDTTASDLVIIIQLLSLIISFVIFVISYRYFIDIVFSREYMKLYFYLYNLSWFKIFKKYFTLYPIKEFRSKCLGILGYLLDNEEGIMENFDYYQIFLFIADKNNTIRLNTWRYNIHKSIFLQWFMKKLLYMIQKSFNILYRLYLFPQLCLALLGCIELFQGKFHYIYYYLPCIVILNLLTKYYIFLKEKEGMKDANIICYFYLNSIP